LDEGLSIPDTSDIINTVQGSIDAKGNITVTNGNDSLEQFMTDQLMPLVTSIATDAKRQADKKETTELYMDTRQVASAVNKQNRTNGYSFIH